MQAIVSWRLTYTDPAGLLPAVCPIDGHLTDAFVWTSSTDQTIADCYFNDPTESGPSAFYQVQASDGFRRFPFDAPDTNPNVDVAYNSGPTPFDVSAGDVLWAVNDEFVTAPDIMIFGFVIVGAGPPGGPTFAGIGAGNRGIIRLGAPARHRLHKP